MGRKTRVGGKAVRIGDKVSSHWEVSLCSDEDGEFKNYKCKCCGISWRNLTPTKQAAHTAALPSHYGLSMNACEESIVQLETKEIDAILSCFKQGQEFLKARDKGDPSKSHEGQRNLIDMVDQCMQQEIEDNLMRAHFHQGNLSDLFWDNPHLQQALVKLAKAKPFDFKPIKRKQIPLKHLPRQKHRVEKLVALLEKDHPGFVKTLTCDGWENILKLHWLAKCVITEKGSFFRDAVDCTNVPSMNADWVYQTLADFIIAEGGAEFVNGIVVDSPNVNKAGLKKVEAMYPTICTLLCTCHIISLFIKDVFKEGACKELYRLANQLGIKFRNVKWLADQLAAAQLSDELKVLLQFQHGPIRPLKASATRMALKMMLVLRNKDLLPAYKRVCDSPAYTDKYESDDVLEHRGESDDEYEKKDKRSVSEVLLESKDKLLSDREKIKFQDDLIKCLLPAFELLRLCDGSQLMSGELWRESWKVQEHLRDYDEVEGLEHVSALWAKRWAQFHHPAYSLAYVVNPRHFGCDQMSDDSVKADVSKMLKRFFPNIERRAAVEGALDRYLKQEGNFAQLDEVADERTVWSKTFIKTATPWGWWDKALLGPAEDGEEDLIWCAKRVLQLGVSSSINERIFSHWKNIMGNHRTRLGRKRQRDQVFVYSNERVLCQVSKKQCVDMSSSEDENEEVEV